MEGIFALGGRYYDLSLQVDFPSTKATGADVSTADFAVALLNVQGDAAVSTVAKSVGGLITGSELPLLKVKKTFLFEMGHFSGYDDAAVAALVRFARQGTRPAVDAAPAEAVHAPLRDSLESDLALKSRLGSLFHVPIPNQHDQAHETRKKRGQQPHQRHEFDDQEHPEDEDTHDYGSDTYAADEPDSADGAELITYY